MPILALAVYSDDVNVFNAICAGASGYFLKNTPPATIAGLTVGSRRMAARRCRRKLRGASSLSSGVPAPGARVLPSDATGTELLKLMVEGHHYKTAAREMGISTNTVSFHLDISTKSCRSTPRRRPREGLA